MDSDTNINTKPAMTTTSSILTTSNNNSNSINNNSIIITNTNSLLATANQSNLKGAYVNPIVSTDIDPAK